MRDVIVAWAIGTAAVVAACAKPYPTAADETFTSVEMALVNQTARWAGQLKVSVRGEITEKMYPGLEAQNPTGWYKSGVAYYYRPNVARWVSLVPEPGKATASSVAAHEVAHALYYMHGAEHWCCIQHMGAEATYPPPVHGLICKGVATQCEVGR